MRDVKIGVMEAWTQLKLMLFRSKTLVALLALTSLLISYLQPLADVAAEINQEINPVEPFLLLINSGGSFPSPFFYIYIFFVALLGDLPMFEHGFRYRLIRMSKRSWYIGQVVLTLLFTLVFTAFIWTVSLLPFIGRFGSSGEWSRCIISLAKTNMTSARGIDLMLDMSIIRIYSPMQALGYTVLYFAAYLFFSALFVVAVHTEWPSIRPAGICGLLAIYLFDYIRINYLAYKYVRYSITAMARLATLDNGYTQYAPTMQYVNLVWAVLIILLLIILYLTARRLQTDEKTAEEV
ncbi:MAG: hypothetical protein E7337_06035 [Clostridiales bacterium]|jgi:hypothetical protein|nr:hypothetical protein [Clostridiales bacterium]MBQ2957269.1 hypothetical protein [Clostridia bacterium]